MKYIICESDTHILPLVFDDAMIHLFMAQSVVFEHEDAKVVSAGFIRRVQDKWVCYGESDSLGLKAAEGDGALISGWFAGYSGLNLMNLRMAVQMGLPIPEFKEA